MQKLSKKWGWIHPWQYSVACLMLIFKDASLIANYLLKGTPV